MRLTTRDKLIIDLLQNQEFCFYKDICQKFFPSKSSASQSLKRLVQSGHIVVDTADKLRKSHLDDLSCSLISNNQSIVYLGHKYKLLKRRPSFWKQTHQLFLFSLKERLEVLLKTDAVFENQIRDLKNTLYSSINEPLPDFYLKGDSFKLAIEFELNLKSQDRYFLKMAEYRRSSFTHVLYVSTHIRKIQRLVKTFRYRNYIAISHYSDIEEVMSHRYGKLSLLEWLEKERK